MKEKSDLEKKVNELSSLDRIAFTIARDYYTSDTLSHAMTVADTIDKMNPHYNKTVGIDFEATDIDVFWKKATIVAMLHDIIEDTNCTVDVLKEKNIPDDVINAILLVTRPKEKHDYFDDYIMKIAKNELSRVVKIADLEHNMDVRRLPKFSEYEQKRLMKYWYSWKYLKREINEVSAHNALHPDDKWR